MRWLLPMVVVAVVINVALASSARKPARVAIPYTPTFIEQVQRGNVASISSRGTTIRGDLKVAVSYPATGEEATRSSRFSTEVPAFADTKALSGLLQAHRVVVNAKPIDPVRSLGSVLLGFLPTIVILALIFFFVRRAMARDGLGGGGLAGLGRSRARRTEPAAVHVTFDDVAGIDDAKADLAEIVDFLRDPAGTAASAGAFPAGCCCPGRPGPARRCLRGRWPGRRACRSFSSRRRSSSR
jgi:cell division protease FtsH